MSGQEVFHDDWCPLNGCRCGKCGPCAEMPECPTPVPSEVAETTADERCTTTSATYEDDDGVLRCWDCSGIAHETTAGERVCARCGLHAKAIRAGVFCDPPHGNSHVLPLVPAEPDAEPDAGEVEALALAEQVCPCDGNHHNPGESMECAWALMMARAVLASDWLAALLDRVRREEGAKVLREAAEAAEGQCWCQVDLNPISSKSCEAITDEAARWLRDRAASVGRGEGP